MGIFAGLFGRRASMHAEKLKTIRKLDGRSIKYVTERFPDKETEPDAGEAGGAASGDIVIGRAGALILKDGELLVYSDENVLFRADINELDASELMSFEGVILSAPDLEHGRCVRTIIAYYTYYRK